MPYCHKFVLCALGCIPYCSGTENGCRTNVQSCGQIQGKMIKIRAIKGKYGIMAYSVQALFLKTKPPVSEWWEGECWGGEGQNGVLWPQESLLGALASPLSQLPVEMGVGQRGMGMWVCFLFSLHHLPPLLPSNFEVLTDKLHSVSLIEQHELSFKWLTLLVSLVNIFKHLWLLSSNIG